MRFSRNGASVRAGPMPVVIAQLPFPSQTSPHSTLSAYYETYFSRFQELAGVPAGKAGDLWEPPLWAAHLAGAIGAGRSVFFDLSLEAYSAEACVDNIDARLSGNGSATVCFSPLAQNLALATTVAKGLRKRGHRVVLGGNMAGLADETAFDLVVEGLAVPELDELLHRNGRLGARSRRGTRGVIGHVPDLSILGGFSERAGIVRLNASHGCLFRCSFCGDAWSEQLHLVRKENLRREIVALKETFPEAEICYIGDKTFGQSPEAARNLAEVVADEQPGFRFIAQTHFSVVTAELITLMKKIGICVVEIGFESGDGDLLKAVRKPGKLANFHDRCKLLADAGIQVVLNVMGGLPHSTRRSCERTADMLAEGSSHVALYNLYNFVPYPLAPIFEDLRPRIFDWDFDHWREDAPVVFEPYHLSVDESWEQFLSLVALCHDLIETH